MRQGFIWLCPVVATLLTCFHGHATQKRLVPIPGSYVIVSHDYLVGDLADNPAQRKAIYPRIKKLYGGRYIMTYQSGRLGPRIFFSTSDDLVHWSRPKLMLAPEKVEVEGVMDLQLYSTMDMAVMPDGEILAVCSFRARKLYSKDKGGGIVLLRGSSDGLVWTEPQVIYRGINWEPCLLRLPDGRLQCFFTDTTPSVKSSCTSVIESVDGGRNWSRKVVASSHYKYDVEGSPVTTDQMPCFRLLNDGKTLFGIVEARIEEPAMLPPKGKSSYRLSVIRTSGTNWSSGMTQWKEELFMHGAAGYVSVFPSGDIVLSCNVNGTFMMRLVPPSGRLQEGESWADGWMQALPDSGYWGCTEIIGEDMLVCAMHCEDGIQIRQFRLRD